MAVVTKGVGVRWGTQTGFTAGVTMNAASMIQSADLTLNPNRQEMLNQYGQKVGLSYIDYDKAITITVVPARTGATAITDAATEAAALMPAAGTAVQLSNGGTAWIASGAADWMVIGSRVRETNTGPIMIEMDLVNYSAITDYTDIAI